jgi:hypothetical protein
VAVWSGFKRSQPESRSTVPSSVLRPGNKSSRCWFLKRTDECADDTSSSYNLAILRILGGLIDLLKLSCQPFGFRGGLGWPTRVVDGEQDGCRYCEATVYHGNFPRAAKDSPGQLLLEMGTSGRWAPPCIRRTEVEPVPFQKTQKAPLRFGGKRSAPPPEAPLTPAVLDPVFRGSTTRNSAEPSEFKIRS